MSMMKFPKRMVHAVLHGLLTNCALLALAATTAYAQQTTGVPGSPGATTTIDGRYIPPQTPPFPGHIEPNAAQSTHAWPMLVTPPKGAPNILLIMTDTSASARPRPSGA
jgi:hypothetical protein